MRATIRWQKYVSEYLVRARDVECTAFEHEAERGRGAASLRLVPGDSVPTEWPEHGSLIELLQGYRVVAVGRVVVK